MEDPTKEGSLTAKLSHRKEQLENELERIAQAQKILDDNPALEKLFDIVGPVRTI